MRLNYELLDPKHRKTVENIESKPHVKYIRYLLTKMYSPIVIKKELQKLGLSAPHEQPLTIYYLAVIDPVIRHFGLSPVYADYKNRLLSSSKRGRGDYAKNILNYRLQFGENPDEQARFCQMVKLLEIDPMWIYEIYKFHGSAINMPVDDKGNRILTSTASTRSNGSVEKILLFEKRYLIDKFLLENVPIDRITKYCRETLKFNVQDPEIKIYKAMFFNVQTQTIEEKIKSLEYEKNSLETLVQDITEGAGEYADISVGEKVTLVEQNKRRITELQDNIKGLNALYSESAFRVAEMNENSFQDMFADVVGRSYARFKQLDSYKDRDVVDCLFKTARMMTFAHDKVEAIQQASTNKATSDKHSQEIILELYGNRVDEIIEENRKRIAEQTGDESFGQVDLDDVEGMDELGVSFDIVE